MRKLTNLLLLLMISGNVLAQNLVPNGDFEQYSSCPTNFSEIDSALFWTVPTTFSSTDYYNACANGTSILVGVPTNLSGSNYTVAHSGDGYAGIYLSAIVAGPDKREHIEVPLTSALLAGETYHFEMYVTLSSNCIYTTDAIGVYFSDTMLSGINNTEPLPFVPQITNTSGNVFDTLNWTLVQGDFTAVGGEQFLTISNFLYDSSTVFTMVNPTGSNLVYVFLDDVSLSNVTGLNEGSKVSTVVYPNPFSTNLNVELRTEEQAEIILYDIASRKILEETFVKSVSLNTEQLAKGIYIFELRDKNGLVKKGKVVKN